MTTMTQPGFSAEVSLVRSNVQYQQVAWDDASRSNGELIQQECVCTPDGAQCCCCTSHGCKCFPIGAIQ